MRTHATAQNIGSRSNQCDATATYTNTRTGARAYVLLDGIGSTTAVRAWTHTAARRLARAAAARGNAEAGLRAVYNTYATDPHRQDEYFRHCLPSAAAVVAVTAPGQPLTIAWCGDSRAYMLVCGTVRCLTRDHNLRRVWPPDGNRNRITSYLGSASTDDEVSAMHNHPAIETATREPENCRLLLASDGAYEPLEDTACNLADYLIGDPLKAARGFVDAAVTRASSLPDPYADNATALVADLRQDRPDLTVADKHGPA